MQLGISHRPIESFLLDFLSYWQAPNHCLMTVVNRASWRINSISRGLFLLHFVDAEDLTNYNWKSIHIIYTGVLQSGFKKHTCFFFNIAFIGRYIQCFLWFFWQKFVFFSMPWVLWFPPPHIPDLPIRPLHPRPRPSFLVPPASLPLEPLFPVWRSLCGCMTMEVH